VQITETLYVWKRGDWRRWLSKNHKTKREIWLIFYKKASNKPRISYDDAVEEALCFGWIDSTVKKVDEESFAQRFTPRNPKSGLSETNKERMRRLIKQKKMTKAGLLAVAAVFNHKTDDYALPQDILEELKKDPIVWRNFQNFPAHYQKIRIGFIEGARNRPEMFRRRLSYFIKMTKLNKKFGMVQ